jgi:hypothetical protein
MSRVFDAENRALRAEEVVAALYEPRVQRALHLVLRDRAMTRAFDEARLLGLPLDDTIEVLRGPYVMPGSGVYYLSTERVRSIVYRKDASS